MQQQDGTTRQRSPAEPLDEALALDREEVVLGESEAGRLTSKALLALARAARAFLFYDPQNDAIRAFLEDLREQMQHAFRHGKMVLVIQPWKILREHEVVYQETDRERSLSFRLYRDGVRKLTIHPTVTWEELTRLLGVFSVRYTGVRQQEEDIVTLLWRAGFKSIEVVSVEGFQPEDDEAEAAAAQGLEHHRESYTAAFTASYRFDYPWPPYSELGIVTGAKVDEVQLHMLQAEDRPPALAGQCVRLVEELLQASADPASGIEPDSLLAMLREVRGYLLEQGGLDELLAMLKACYRVHEAAQDRSGTITREVVLGVFAEPDVLERIIKLSTSTTVSPALLELLSLLPGDSLTAALSLLSHRWDQAKNLGMQLVATTPADRIAPLISFAASARGAMATDLLKVVASYHQEHAVPLSLEYLQHGDQEAKLIALAVLKKAQYIRDVGRVLCGCLDDPSEEVRISTAILLAMNLERRAFDIIVGSIEKRAQSGISDKEAEVMGMVMAKLEPARALTRFEEWAKPPRMLGTLKPGREALCRTAVCGLAMVPGKSSEGLVRQVMKKASGELKQRCAQTLSTLRRHSARINKG
jgi:hypothetical protein